MRKADKINGDVEFFEDTHEYLNRVTGSRYVSVTTLIHKYVNEFDAGFWSAYKAFESLMDDGEFKKRKPAWLKSKRFKDLDGTVVELGIDPVVFAAKRQEILDGYGQASAEACKYGTAVHAKLENSFYDSKYFELDKYGLVGADGGYKCVKGDYVLDRDGVFPEYFVHRSMFDGKLNIAGSIDLLVKKEKSIWLLDWKTSKSIDMKSFYDQSNGYKRMKFPLSGVMDSNYWHYALQLSTYAYLLKDMDPELDVKGLVVYHIPKDGESKSYPVPFMRNEVKLMLNHYKKRLLAQEKLDRDKPIKL